MPQYFFILGKNPTLSTAEIISVLNKFQIPFTFKTHSEEVLVLSTEDELPLEFIKTLGGTIKIGKIIDEAGLDDDELLFEKIFEGQNIADNYLSTKDGKLHFGISIYNGGADNKVIKELNSQLKYLCVTVKNNLKNLDLKAGFVRIKDRYLSSVSVWKNQLLEKGMEVVLICTKEKILAGKTLEVQEFESFSFRDYGRPQRDTKSGLIPPKLARMMINFAQVGNEVRLLDPFCGSGTILQEAILLGYKKIYGSDISQKAIYDTNTNIDWLFENFRQVDKSVFNIEIFLSDVRAITRNIPQDSIDAVITEPYLGPPLFRRPSYENINSTLSEVGRLYLSAFSELRKILKTGGKVIIVFPAFEDWGKMYFVEILSKIKEMGFSQTEMIPTEIADNSFIKLTNRGTILYGDNEQFMKREVLSFQKK